MKNVNFAFELDIIQDGRVSYDRRIYSGNIYDDKLYPLNGPTDICYFDYHAPLHYVCSQHHTKLNVVCKSYSDFIKEDEFFFYVLTFRQFSYSFTTRKEATQNFFLKLPYGIIQAVKRNKCKLIFNDVHEHHIYNDLLFQNLEKQLLEVDIPIEKIVIVTNNRTNLNLNTKFNLIGWEYFETVLRLLTKKNNVVHGELDLEQRFKNYTDVKHFIFLNRIPKEHRYYLAYQFFKKDLIKNMRISLDQVAKADIISHLNNVLLEKISDQDYETFFNELPYLVDTENFNENHWATISYEHSYRNLISIVSETLYHTSDAILLSEKILKPISLKMPFIVAGQPHTLKRLQDLGYKTFNSLWDESYDTEEDVVKRMDMIIALVEQLSDMPLRELRDLIHQSKKILIHNYELLMNNNAECDFINWIEENSHG